MRAGRIGARVDLRTDGTVLQDRLPFGRAEATVGRGRVDAQTLGALVLTLNFTVIVVLSDSSSRTREILARKAILGKLHSSRTGAFVTTGNIDALVRTLVFAV